MLGIKEIYIEDLCEEFVRDFVFPIFRTNAVYEGVYLLGISIARSLISKHLIEITKETGADAIAHGATGKRNDQVRFELFAYALGPNIKVKDVAGFIKLNALRLRTLAMRSSKL
ncbi:argininosuccinate synthase [Bartonella chomelii]|uniref:Argininosuccinate synthase n=1 Tax=Bartonella chomelii TaxID=236402 RepID=A0ABR6E2X1_9HYPH|nr:argininosuccinate synthase [Bartonella chomelii]